MKRKQILAIILSASMFLGSSMGSVSFAKETSENLLSVQEMTSAQNDVYIAEKEPEIPESPGDPAELEKSGSRESSSADSQESEENLSEDTTDVQEKETVSTQGDEAAVSTQSDDAAVQAVTGTVIYLDAASGSDTANNGSAAAQAVQTLEKALELAGANGTVMVTGASAPIITTDLTLTNGVTVKRDPALKDNQPVLEINGGSLTINDATVDGGKNETVEGSASGSVIFMRKGMLTLNDGGKIANCWENGVYVFTGLPDGESTFIMNGGEICNIGGSTVAGQQQTAAVWIAAGTSSYPKASFTMRGGSIHDNIVGAGAVYLPIAYAGFPQEFNMEGGSIVNNKGIDEKNSFGNGILLRDGTVNISGGEISGNSGMNGGGVYVQDNGKFTMSGGTISGNSALGTASTDGYGGGICVRDDTATVTITGGVISGNNAKRGGGICAWDNSLVEISGGTISENTSRYGGGIRAEGSARLNITGGTIENNESTDWAGGVEALGTSTVNIIGGKISGNTSPWGGGMFIWQTKNVTIGGDVEITNNEATTDGGGGIDINSGAVNITGGTISGNTSNVGGGVQVEGGSVAIGGTAKITRNETTGNGGGGGVAVNGGTLNITGGTISENTSNYGGGVAIWDKGVVTIEGNTLITKNKATGDGGGGISVSGQTLTLNGGTISENEAFEGAGIATWSAGKVVMNDNVQITGNKVKTGKANATGGVVNIFGSGEGGSTFTMNGGSITNNISEDENCPGIVAYGGSTGGNIVVSGGTISGNTTAQGTKQAIRLYKGSAMNGTVKLSGSPDITDEIFLNDNQDNTAKVEITGTFNPKNPIPINDTSWTDYRTIVTYAAGLTAKTDNFTPASGSERQVIIKDENDAQNLQSLNKRSVIFQEKDDATQKYGELYVLPKEKIATDQVPSVKKEDNELLGWKNAKNDEDWDFATDTVTEDTILYPVWKSTAKYYTVKYETGSKYATIKDYQVKEGNKTIEPEITWKGWTLDGWYTTSDFQEGTKWNFDDPVMSNMTLYAKWLLNAPTGTLEAEDTGHVTNQKVTIHTGESVVLTAKASHEVTGDISYQFTWFKDGKEIDVKNQGRAATEQNKLEVSEAGTYSVKIVARIVGDDGTVTSESVETNTMEVNVTDHDFGEWVIIKQPTETEKGLKERSCTICGIKETAEIPATGKKDDPKPDPTPDDPKPEPTPDDKKDDTKPGTDKKNESVITETTTTTTVETVTSNGVKTGDTNSLGLAVSVMTLAAGAGAGVVLRRKKRS